MRVLLLSRYAPLGASSRLRSHQYLPYLKGVGFEITVAPLFGNDYVRGLSSGDLSKRAVMQYYIDRFRFILKAREFDLVWLEKEMLPWLPSWIELAIFPKNIPLVADYDDAIFHRYDQHNLYLIRKLLGQKISAIMRRADLVIAGNNFLSKYAKVAGAQRVEILPTVVDENRYFVTDKTSTLAITIGWIGQSSTAKYLDMLAPVLKKLISKHSVRLVAIGPMPKQLEHLPIPIEVLPWTEDTEAVDIAQFDIGVMPLPNELWERGKCGYKLIQYMACGKPVVASPVGVNNVIVSHGLNGFLAESETEWYDALDTLCNDTTLRKRMGNAGRVIMEQSYSLQITAPQLASLLHWAANQRSTI